MEGIEESTNDETIQTSTNEEVNTQASTKIETKALTRKQFKQRRSFSARLKESAKMRSKYPSKVPVIMERYTKEKNLPKSENTKFLISQGISMTQFSSVIRERMSLSSLQSLYFMINQNTLVSMSMTFGELYNLEKDKDGFLYVNYASQEVFG